MPAIRLALLEGDPEVRALLHGYLCHQPDLTCEVVAASVEHLLAQLPALPQPPQVLLLDGNLLGNGVLSQLKQLLPHTALVLQTVFDDADRIFQGLCQGASGYVLKNTPLAEIAATVRVVARGGALMHRAVARKALAHLQAAPTQLAPFEQAVVQAIVEGLPDGQVVDRLGSSLEAVQASNRRVYEKLAASAPARRAVAAQR